MATGAWNASMPMKCMDQMAPARHSPPSSPQTRRMLRLCTWSRCRAMQGAEAADTGDDVRQSHQPGDVSVVEKKLPLFGHIDKKADRESFHSHLPPPCGGVSVQFDELRAYFASQSGIGQKMTSSIVLARNRAFCLMSAGYQAGWHLPTLACTNQGCGCRRVGVRTWMSVSRFQAEEHGADATGAMRIDVHERRAALSRWAGERRALRR